MKAEKLPDIHKIAVLRANVLGDFIFVLPALRALREAYPEAEITLLGKAWHKSFVPGRVGTIDKVMVVPPTRGVGEEEDYKNNSGELQQFFEKARQEKFDLAFQLHGGGRHSNPFVAQLGAGLTVGLQAKDALPLNINVPYIYYQNEVLRYLEVVSYAGARTVWLSPAVSVTAADVAEAQAVTAGGAVPYIVLHPGASDVRRCWPSERFMTVAKHFLHAGYAVYVTGVESEAELVEDIIKGTGGKAVSLAGRISLGGLAALLQRSALVVSNDTGPLHLAAATGARTVGIYWCGNLINAGTMTRANHRPLLSWILECPDCAKIPASDRQTKGAVCPHSVSFVAGVTVEDCLTASEDLLGST